MSKQTLKEGKFFRLIKTGKQFWIQVKPRDALPAARRVREKDATYLLGLSHEFDAACVWDFGCGVWQRTKRTTHHKYT